MPAHIVTHHGEHDCPSGMAQDYLWLTWAVVCAAFMQGLHDCMPRLLAGLFAHASEPLLVDAAAAALLALIHAFPGAFDSCGTPCTRGTARAAHC